MGNDGQSARVHHLSDGGLAGKHPPPADFQFLVGPTTDAQFNTARLRLIPLACWRVDDVRFHFDSSFVLPEIRVEMAALARLLKEHTDCPISVFGHADPVGPDDYNKVLSGRRATAIYAMLTRNADLWDELFNRHFGGDKWGTAALQIMSDAVSGGPGSPVPEDSGGRKQLFTDYMEAICGPDLKLQPTDFLAQGADPKGKGDYQGCSSFNPLLILSRQKATDSERNEDNAPNRRVMVLVFRKGSRVDPNKWPCPCATDGIAGCVKRFFSDGQKRRTTRLPDQDRKYQETQDTFACRFYDRLLQNSPCERLIVVIPVRLYDPEGLAIPQAPYEFQVEGGVAVAGQTADTDGIALIRCAEAQLPTRCDIRWGFKPADGDPPLLIFRLNLFLSIDKQATEQEVVERLNNLGYPPERPLSDNVAEFQEDYGKLASPPLTPSGTLDDQTLALLRKVYDQCAKEIRDTPPGA